METGQHDGVKIRMICAKDGYKYYWRVIDYLQRDAKKQGILRGVDNFSGFWHNIGAITDNINRVYIALDTRNRVAGYMVAVHLGHICTYDEPHIDIIEVLPQFRFRGVGTAMMRWAFEQVMEQDGNKLSLDPLRGKEGFFTKLGFVKTERNGSGKYLITFPKPATDEDVDDDLISADLQ